MNALVAGFLVVGCYSADLNADGLVSRADLAVAPAALERYVAACVGKPTGPVCGAFALGYLGAPPVLAPGGWLVSPYSVAVPYITTHVCHLSGPCHLEPAVQVGDEYTYDLPALPAITIHWADYGPGVAYGCAWATP